MKLRLDFKTVGLAALLLGTTMGHGGEGCCHSESVLGPATEAVCPPNSTLTWDNFGRQFMTTYCVSCHDSAKTGDAREGAPLYHDFDTRIGVLQVADHVDQAAASGPAATNDQMPPEGDPQPSLAEREMLAEWIACGVP